MVIIRIENHFAAPVYGNEHLDCWKYGISLKLFGNESHVNVTQLREPPKSNPIQSEPNCPIQIIGTLWLAPKICLPSDYSASSFPRQ